MVKLSTLSKCPKRDGRIHLYDKDEDDKRFKVCRFCGKSLYRSDKELIEEARK